MQKTIVLLIVLFLSISCNRESSIFMWEKSMGEGNSFFVNESPDSGIVAGGELNHKPFIVEFDRKRSLLYTVSYPGNGVFSSGWGDTSGYIAAGSTEGKMLIARFGRTGRPIWDTTFATSSHISFSRLVYEGGGILLAAGTADPDSTSSGMAGLLFVRFDTTGNIITKKEVTDDWFTAAGNIAEDGSGNIYIPVTNRSNSSRPRAAIAKFSPDLNLTWQTDLYNNSSYSSSATSVFLDGSYIYVTGRTEMAEQEGTVDDSFIAALNASGLLAWKKYMEIYNAGSRFRINDEGTMMLMNRNCFLINLLSNFGSDSAPDISGLLRLFDGCDSKNTDAAGNDFYIDHEGNITACGSLGGNFYISVKSASQ